MKFTPQISPYNFALAITFVGFPLFYAMRFVGPSFSQEIGFSHFLLFSLLVILPVSAKKLRTLLPHELFFLLWITFAFFGIFIYFIFGYSMHAVQGQLVGFIQATALFVIFRSFRHAGGSFNFVISISALTSIIAVMAVPNQLDASNYLLASYQTLGFVIFTIGYLAISYGGKYFGSLIAIISMIALFENGARTEFAVFVMLFSVNYILVNKSSSLFLIPLSIFLVVALAPEVMSLIGSEDVSRTIGLLNITADESFLARQVINATALQTIMDNPILGSYASYESGFYAHNLLSVWVDFGLFGFLIYCSLAVFLFVTAFQLKTIEDRRNWALILLVTAFIITIIFAKVYYHPMIGMVVGAISSQKLNVRRI